MREVNPTELLVLLRRDRERSAIVAEIGDAITAGRQISIQSSTCPVNATLPSLAVRSSWASEHGRTIPALADLVASLSEVDPRADVTNYLVETPNAFFRYVVDSESRFLGCVRSTRPKLTS